MQRTLSKSDYKLARTCVTKLYYKELGYPDTRDDNAYLQMLADGGYMIEQLARLLYPDGIEMPFGGDPTAAASATAAKLAEENVTLFEATLLSNKKQARVDILRKRGNHFDLIEVKSKSFNSDDVRDYPDGPFRGKSGKGITADWGAYLEDITFQVLTLRELFPRADITPYLLLVDKARPTTIEGLPGFFDIRNDVEIDGRKKDRDIRYTGDPHTPAAHEILKVVDVSSEVGSLLPSVTAEATRFAALYLGEEIVREQAPISFDCKDCEFRMKHGEKPNGLRECWGPLADSNPHIFDLYSFGATKSGAERLADIMIQMGKSHLSDVDHKFLVKKDGSPTAASTRQILQIECATSGEAWVGSAMKGMLAAWQFPIHFIDFETSAIAAPYHAGMYPYELVGFQWSCHSFDSPDSQPVHREWLNNVDSWPCLEFAETLREAVGDKGTVLMWTGHEKTSLKRVREQMDRYNVGTAELRLWIDTLVNQRLLDMNRVCVDSFIHPKMGGRTSIKVVLDALWKTDPEMRSRFTEWMGSSAFDVADDSGPYEALPTITIDGVELDVSEGTGAMRAYQDMLYGASRHDPAKAAAYRDLLLRYCKLDTVAMVLIWDHWKRVAH